MILSNCLVLLFDVVVGVSISKETTSSCRESYGSVRTSERLEAPATGVVAGLEIFLFAFSPSTAESPAFGVGIDGSSEVKIGRILRLNDPPFTTLQPAFSSITGTMLVCKAEEIALNHETNLYSCNGT